MAHLVADLERSNRALDEFAYVASHDLKEPLRGITINANFLLREKPSAAVKKRGQRIVELGVRMENLISDLLRFSRLGRDKHREAIVDTEMVVEKSRKLFEEFTDETSAQLTIDAKLPDVKADPARVLTVYQNLIANALKYNKSGPKVIQVGFTDCARIGDKEIADAFYVRDNGIGIDAKFHDKVFEIFTRLNSSSDFGPGTGAGLAFVKRIVDEWGGDFGVTSSPGKGSTFFFSMPLSKRTKRSAVPAPELSERSAHE
ncbi:sensor histidine kinase [Roseovarius aestuarii]|nr:ATP-binding protein [Roseovarius aestuarii]